MIFGSLPIFAAASRIAARSTSSGTPVKSCSTMRATTKGISSVRGAFGCQLASWRTCASETFLPSQLRKTDSSTMRIDTGRREIFPMAAASSAGSEYSVPCLPLARVKDWRVLNRLCVMAESPNWWIARLQMPNLTTKAPRRTVASGLSARRTERRNRNVQKVHEDFEYRATPQSSRAVGYSRRLAIRPAMPGPETALPYSRIG